MHRLTSRRPEKLRKPNGPHELIIAVKEVRQKYPRWGKENLFPFIQAQGLQISELTVGRIISYLKSEET